MSSGFNKDIESYFCEYEFSRNETMLYNMALKNRFRFLKETDIHCKPDSKSNKVCNVHKYIKFCLVFLSFPFLTCIQRNKYLNYICQKCALRCNDWREM